MRTSSPPSTLQVERVHELGDDEQAAAVVGQQVGQRVGVERGDVEAAAVVFDGGDQVAALEVQRDLDGLLDAAVTDGVGGGLFDAQHDVVDHERVGAVLAQVVANAVAGAQQVRRSRRYAKVQSGGRDLRRGAALRQVAPRVRSVL